MSIIVGLGTDLVLDRRLSPWLAKPGLLAKVFTTKELEFSERSLLAHLASAFASKEAALKALGKDFSFLPPTAISYVREAGQAPHIAFSSTGKAKISRNLGLSNLKTFLSISHERGLTSAVCLICEEEAINNE